jgi:hypothetical protein
MPISKGRKGDGSQIIKAEKCHSKLYWYSILIICFLCRRKFFLLIKKEHTQPQVQMTALFNFETVLPSPLHPIGANWYVISSESFLVPLNFLEKAEWNWETKVTDSLYVIMDCWLTFYLKYHLRWRISLRNSVFSTYIIMVSSF